MAVESNTAGMVRLLIEHGADVTAAPPDGETGYSRFAEMADMLIGAGAEIEVRNSYNQTPLHVTTGRVNLTVV